MVYEVISILLLFESAFLDQVLVMLWELACLDKSSWDRSETNFLHIEFDIAGKGVLLLCFLFFLDLELMVLDVSFPIIVEAFIIKKLSYGSGHANSLISSARRLLFEDNFDNVVHREGWPMINCH